MWMIIIRGVTVIPALAVIMCMAGGQPKDLLLGLKILKMLFCLN